MCTKAIALRCQNPECKRSSAPTLRIKPDGSPLGFICKDCMDLLHGPNELQFICRGCGHDDQNCTCFESIEFIYGGPVVICEQCLKQTVWIDHQSGVGFAGGRIYLETFSCGHDVLDEEDDIRAAY